jgi:hypothetical protein
MDISQVITEIDTQIAQLQTARIAIASLGINTSTKRGPGRPKKTMPVVAPKTRGGKRTMSPEGRARVATAQKKRWAAQKKTAKKS